MVVRINSPTYSVANKSISTSDQREGSGHGGGRQHNSHQEENHPKEIISKKSSVDINELQNMVDALNKSDYYQNKGFTFKCRDDAEELHVEVYTQQNKLIQRVPAEQIQKMFEALNLEHSSSQTGSLINVSC